MKKKLACLSLMALSGVTLASCTGRNTLLFLNWGEYIDETLLDAFEEEYHCNVVMDLGETNEIFYSKVRGGTTVYDVVCPSDYMVEKMYENDLLEKIDYSKLSSFDRSDLRVGVENIFNQMDENLKAKLGSKYDSKNKPIQDYAVPYLWGTWGICYTTGKEAVDTYFKTLEEDAAKTTPTMNQWASLYDRSVFNGSVKVANYDSSNHAYYSACKYLGLDSYNELADSDLQLIEKTMKNMNFDAWGTDSIKKDIVAGNIDLGFMWTGDFLYYYAEVCADVTVEAYMEEKITKDEIYPMIDAMINTPEKVYKSKSGEEFSIGFDIFIPDDTIAFCDNLVITKDSANKDLAYKFIDFMASADNSYTNTYYVDYDATTETVYDTLVALSDKDENPLDDAYIEDFDANNAGDSDLYSYMYDVAIGFGFNKYYPKDTTKGKILANFDRKYVNKINTTINNSKV